MKKSGKEGKIQADDLESRCFGMFFPIDRKRQGSLKKGSALMRIQSWLLLAVVMGGGTAFAFLVGLVWFPLKPVAVPKEVPKSQILVAKKDIPAGTVLYADSVQYDFVPNNRIPIGATNNFFRIYAHKTLNPISQGSPICDLDIEETLVSPMENSGNIPVGMNLVRVQIDRIQGTPITNTASRFIEGAFSVDFLAGSLKPNDLVDLMVLETSQKLADLGGNVFIRKSPKLVASGIQVHSAVEMPSKPSSPWVNEGTSVEYPSLMLLMTPEQINLARTAAKEGRLQVFSHQVEEKTIAQTTGPSLAEPAVNVASQVDLPKIEANTLQSGEIMPVAVTLPVEEKSTSPEKNRPKVIDIGLGTYRKPVSGSERPTGSPSNPTETSTRKSSGGGPILEIYSFAPKNRKKTDLFPKHFYGITELHQNLEPSAPIAAL